MKSCFVHLVLIFWHTSFTLTSGSVQASNCSTNDLRCDISEDFSKDSNKSICIPPMSDIQNYIDIGQAMNFTCRWTEEQGGDTYKWYIRALGGLQILLSVNSERRLKFEAGNIHNNISEAASFNSVEDNEFHSVDEFLSRTNMIWIQAIINEDYFPRDSDINETFDIITRTVKVKDSVDTQNDECDFRRMSGWAETGYHFTVNKDKGSLIIMCNKTSFQAPGIFISFFYDIERSLIGPLNGSLQFVYVRPRNLMNLETPSLTMNCDVSQCDSFRVQFDAKGHMELNIYNVTVQSLIYADGDRAPKCIPETSSPPTQFSSSRSLNSTLPVHSSSTDAEGKTSDIHTLTTGGFNALMERQGTDGLQGFLIPTVSVIAIVSLVLIAVISVYCKKRYYKMQSRDTGSTALEDPISLNNERHDYYEVRPSGKRPSGETVNGVIEPSLAIKDNNSTVTGSIKVPTYEGTVDSDDKSDEVESPSAKNTVFMNGQEYAMVDMEKKAFECRERAETMRNKGHYLESNGDNAYATLEAVKACEEEDGKTKPKDSYLSSFKRVLMNENEYAVVDMEKRALERRERAEIACNNGQYLESNDKKAGTLEPDKASEDGQTKLKNSNPSSFKGAPRFSSVKKSLHDTTSDDYDEVQLSDKGTIYKASEGSTDFDEPEPFRSTTTEPYDELQCKINPNMPFDFSKKSGHQTQGKIIDDSSHAYQTVSAPSSPIDSMRPDSYPLSDYETVSPPMSPGVLSISHGQYPSMNNETAGSPIAAPEEQVQYLLDTYDRVKNEGPPGKRDSSASHTYEDPVAMALALERPYDKLQRASGHREQTATPKILAKSDKEVTEGADPEGELNVYQEIVTPDIVHHLQRPHSKRSKADAPLPEIPGDEGYGKLDLNGAGTPYQTHAAPNLDHVTSGPVAQEAAPVYATLENPAEANLPDNDDPDYDLLDAFV